jgi:hypothetical protein
MVMNLTILLDEPLATQLRREASSRHLSPEQVALDLLGGALGKIAEAGERTPGDLPEAPPAQELACRNQRKDMAQAIVTALRRLLRDLDTPGKATNLALLKRELSKAHHLADCPSEAPYRAIVALAENALAAVPWTEIDAGLLNLLQEQLKLGLEDGPVTTDDYLRTSRVLGDNRYPLGPTFEGADEPDRPIEEEPADESQSFPAFAEILGIQVQTVGFKVAREEKRSREMPKGGNASGD